MRTASFSNWEFMYRSFKFFIRGVYMTERQIQNLQYWKLTLLGICLILIGYLSWCLCTISYKAKIYEYMAFGSTLLTMFCFTGVTVLCCKYNVSKQVKQQWWTICLLVTLCSLLLFCKKGSLLWIENKKSYFVIIILWFVFGVYGVIKTCFCSFKVNSVGLVHRVKACVKHNIGLCSLILITALLCIEPNAFQYRWDGILYYLTCKTLTLGSLSNLAIYGHIAQTFGVLVQVGNILFGDTGLALLVVHMTLMVVSIIYFYGILKSLIPGLGQHMYTCMTAIFAWCPWMIGMVHYYSLDFACQCLITPVLYYLLKRKWILFSFFSILFCFTKEPAVIVYAALCAGTVVVDILIDKDAIWTERIKHCLLRKYYYVMLVPGILWLATYVMLGPWSAGEGGVAFSISYVVDKLKNLYVLNFNWVFTLIIVIGIIRGFGKCKLKLMMHLIPIFFAQLAFTFFSCFFRTVNHPRYNDTNQVTLYILAIMSVCLYSAWKKHVHGYLLLSGVLLISSFYTIDFVSLHVYPTYNIGKTTMLTTDSQQYPFGDSMIYNRQMMGMEKALDRAIEPAIIDNALICFPTVADNPYFFDGMSEVETLSECRVDTELWDTMKRKRVAEYSDTAKKFTVCQLTERIDFNLVQNVAEEYIDLIYMDHFGRRSYDEMRQKYTLVEEDDYSYQGWVINRARFAIN